MTSRRRGSAAASARFGFGARSFALPLVLGGCLVAMAGVLYRPAFPIGEEPTVRASSADRRSASDKGAADVRDTQARAAGPVSDAASPRDDVARMIARGQALIAVGDFAAARLLLQRAADAGNPEAVFALAATYDPNVLAARGARGLTGEPEQAKALYARALAAGMQDAAPRMAALGG